jgi:hypothetical protein
MTRVAIVGSCITRDLWQFQGDTKPDLLYISRTSLPSLFAAPVAGFRPSTTRPTELKRQPDRALTADLQKTALAALVAYRPTHVIFDFIDERYDLLSIGSSLVTHSWELEVSGYLKTPAFRGARGIPRLSPAADRLWLAGAGEFAAFIRATPLRDAKLILHAARWADRRRDADGVEHLLEHVEILPEQPADIAAHNALLAQYEDAFTEIMPSMSRVEAPSQRIADSVHRWGLSPFHYVPEYYDAIARQLDVLGVRTRVPA